jgi:pilus assembly protein CpaE
LADAPFFRPQKQITSKQVTKFFDILKECFSYIVVDTDSTFDATTITTLDYSDMVFLVTIVNLPALRNCQRCLGLFDKLGYDRKKVQIVINRYMENDDITLNDVETLLRKKIYWKIPNNYFALMASINKGVLLSEVNPTSNVAQSYKDLAINVSDSVFKTALIQKFSPADNRRLENILE